MGMRKLFAGFLVLVVLVAFSLPALANETVKGKIEALDKEAKKLLKLMWRSPTRLRPLWKAEW